jgi:hypothetical protein
MRRVWTIWGSWEGRRSPAVVIAGTHSACTPTVPDYHPVAPRPDDRARRELSGEDFYHLAVQGAFSRGQLHPDSSPALWEL